MSQRFINYIDIRLFVNATEDLDKVIEAVQKVLPNDYLEEIVFKKKHLKGHYGNSIILLEAGIRKREILRAFIAKLSSHLSELDKETLGKEINLHVEKRSVYIRLDKQAALEGEFRICSSDPIRLHIRLKKTKDEDIVKICSELGILA